MKNIILLLNIVFINIGFSQGLSGKVIYRVDMDNLIAKMETEEHLNPSNGILMQVAKHIKKFRAELLFTENTAVFKTIESLSLKEDDKNLDNHVKFLISDGSYYSNLIDNVQILMTELDGKVFNVKRNFKKEKWELLNESKKIGGFTCYKAISNGENGIKIAWYTPEIPESLGPKEHVGQLPGLILQLDEPFISYYCSEIKLNMEQTIDWPNGKTISKESFDAILQTAFEEIKNSRN